MMQRWWLLVRYNAVQAMLASLMSMSFALILHLQTLAHPDIPYVAIFRFTREAIFRLLYTSQFLFVSWRCTSTPPDFSAHRAFVCIYPSTFANLCVAFAGSLISVFAVNWLIALSVARNRTTFDRWRFPYGQILHKDLLNNVVYDALKYHWIGRPLQDDFVTLDYRRLATCAILSFGSIKVVGGAFSTLLIGAAQEATRGPTRARAAATLRAFTTRGDSFQTRSPYLYASIEVCLLTVERLIIEAALNHAHRFWI